ncbi:hypothetical protein F4809DRAFT_613876 [Biscogniauxia mediterranea]|nr:hypothetical protein F4809DRAFT_613876 [Biscogniauxia mediterranea]
MASKPTEPSQSVMSSLEAWGNSPLAPMGLATLVTALHFRPLQLRPMLCVPPLVFASYANLQGFKIDGAGVAAAASGAYAVMGLRRRRQQRGGLRARFSARGAVRGVAIGLAAANLVADGWVYATGDRDAEARERADNPRWAE